MNFIYDFVINIKIMTTNIDKKADYTKCSCGKFLKRIDARHRRTKYHLNNTPDKEAEPKAEPKKAEPKKAEPKKNIDYLSLSFGEAGKDPQKFLTFFENSNKKVYENYLRLNREADTLDSFHGNPLVFILLNKPQCCLEICKEYIRQFV